MGTKYDYRVLKNTYRFLCLSMTLSDKSLPSFFIPCSILSNRRTSAFLMDKKKMLSASKLIEIKIKK
jgi:hypothetical protein